MTSAEFSLTELAALLGIPRHVPPAVLATSGLVGDDGFTYILASDRDSGLWIFRYTGP